MAVVVGVGISIALIVAFLVSGILVSKAAVAVAGSDNTDLQTAHKWLSWSTSITWISTGLAVIGAIIALIAGGAFAVVYSPELIAEQGVAKLGGAGANIAKETSDIHKGFMGMQELIEGKGIGIDIVKLVIIVMVIAIILLSILDSVGTFYIWRSSTGTGLELSLGATLTLLVPLAILIAWLIINGGYVSSKKKERKKEIDLILQNAKAK